MISNQESDSDFQSGFGDYELEMMQKMFEDAPVLICILEGPDHRLQYMNKSFRRFYSDPSITPGDPAQDVMLSAKVSEEEVWDQVEMMDKVYQTGEPYKISELKAHFDQTESGEKKAYFNLLYQPLKDINERVYGILVTGHDVTDQVEAGRALSRYENRLKFALSGARIGYWEFSTENQTLYYLSDLCKEHYGRLPDDPFTHEDFMDAIHPDDVYHVWSALGKSLEVPGFSEVEYRVHWPDGSEHWLLSRGKVLNDTVEQMRKMVGITIDITNRKEIEAQLKRAVRIRDDFLSVAAHELQTPVTSIKARAELFERKLRDAGHTHWAEHAGKIHERIQQLSRLTGRLLDISRISEGKFSLQHSVFPLKELIEETVEALEQISTHHIELQVYSAAQVHADRYRIGQVMTNLLENAIKYSPQADRILVRIEEVTGEQQVAVSVVDFGIGVREDEKRRIFERFYKGSGGGRETYPGFGIGLFISAQIIELHGGGISVKDNNGRGTVFTFKLPVAGAENK